MRDVLNVKGYNIMETETALREAPFLVPHLRTGMYVLDVGSGPGTITLGLAEIVAPGLVVGIDIQSVQVEQARELAAARSGGDCKLRGR